MVRIILLAFFPVFLFGQNVEVAGKLIDSKRKSEIAYANIGVLNKTVGTVTDAQGVFNLSLSERVKDTDTVMISMIGYENRTFKVAEFRKALSKSKVIGLTPKSYNLDEITVIPKGNKTKLVGNKKRNENISVSFTNNNMGHEMAVLLKIKKRPTTVEKVFINITGCTYDSIFYRLNIYEYDKKAKTPGKNLLPKPVYLNFTKAETEETLMIDLSDLNVWVKDDFVVSLELIKDLGEGDINFSASFFKSKGFARMISQGGWEEAPIRVGAGIYAEIRYDK
ncbi:MAG: carboxypeptidase-like regulatory domain-containing protein [Saprospiraceae bacterium]